MPIVIVNQNGQISNAQNSRQYDGEKIPGDFKSWAYYGTDPNLILKDSYDILSQRSTTLYHTHPPIASAINKMTHYAIGSGLVFRSQPDWQILGMSREQAKVWSMEFQKLIHYLFRVLNFYEKQAILFRTALILGDSLLFFDRSFDPGALPFDLIEVGGDQINIQGKSSYKRRETTLGIGHDPYLRKLSAIFKDGSETDFTDRNGYQNILQLMFKQMARQIRGYSLAYKLITAAKNNDRWWDATLSRLVMETLILGYSDEQTKENTFKEQIEDYSKIVNNESSGQSENIQGEGVSTTWTSKDVTPGAVLSYKNGGGLKFTDLKTPANNFDKVQEKYIELVGMGTETPAAIVTGNYNVSFTSHKGQLNDYEKVYMMKRNTAIQTVFKKVVLEAAKYFIENKLLRMPHPLFFENAIVQEAAISGNWLGPVPGHISPLDEVRADKEAVEAGFELRSNVASEYGNEYENFIEEWGQTEKEFAKLSPDKKAALMLQDLKNNSQSEVKE